MFLYSAPECVPCECGGTPALYHTAGQHGIVCLNEACVFHKIELDHYQDEESAIAGWNEVMRAKP